MSNINAFNWFGFPSKLGGQRHDKDCLQCCLEMILDIPYDEIPEFYNFKCPNDEYQKWLKQKGYMLICIDALKNENGQVVFPTILNDFKFMYIGVLKKDYNQFSHAVVIEQLENEFRISDPLNNSYYSLDDFKSFELIIKTTTDESIMQDNINRCQNIVSLFEENNIPAQFKTERINKYHIHIDIMVSYKNLLRASNLLSHIKNILKTKYITYSITEM